MKKNTKRSIGFSIMGFYLGVILGVICRNIGMTPKTGFIIGAVLLVVLSIIIILTPNWIAKK